MAAARQWRQLAELLANAGFDVLVAPIDKRSAGATFVGNTAIVLDRSRRTPVARTPVLLATPAASSSDETVARTLRGIGFAQLGELPGRFQGQQDLIRCGPLFVYTSRDAPAPPSGVLGRLRGEGPAAGSDPGLREEVRDAVGDRELLELRLADPAFAFGRAALCAIGPGRDVARVCVEAFEQESRQLILSRGAKLAQQVIPVCREDAAMGVTTGFQFTGADGRKKLVLPEGVSAAALRRIEAVGVDPVPVDLSEWLKKDRGGVSSLVLPLGWIVDDGRTATADVEEFRASIRLAAQ